MPPRQAHPRRGAAFWLVLVGATIFLSLEPGFFLVALAISLSAVALTWIVMLARLLLLDAVQARRQRRLESLSGSGRPGSEKGAA